MVRKLGKKGGKKAYNGKKKSLKIKKSYHYYKGLYQELLYFPRPICWKLTRACSTLCSCQTSDQSILNAKQKKKEKKQKGNSLTAPPPRPEPPTVEQ